MGEDKTLNCIGMKCPRPIIEIAKAARTSEAGTILCVQADDLAFESDVKAWASNTNSEIIEFQYQANVNTVRIKLP